MNFIRKFICLFLLEIFACASMRVYAQDEIPKALRIDLLRLEEAYNILDLYAHEIWPGWNNYDQIPILFVYPNGLKMLIGHPNPPKGFSCLNGFNLRGKKIYIDKRNQNSDNLNYSLLGGGYADELGTFDGKEVNIITIMLSRDKADQKLYDTYKKLYGQKSIYAGSQVEEQILILIHELFHLFQRQYFKAELSNPTFNCDLNYAVYSELEGIELEKIQKCSDPEKIRQYVKEFLMARSLKNKSLSAKDIKAMSAIELFEGTATYVELKALQLMNNKFTADSALINEDKYYAGFRNIEQLIKSRLEWLTQLRENSLLGNLKSYPYGCYQALILDKLFPKWKELLTTDGSQMDQILSRSVKISISDSLNIVESMKSAPEFSSALTRHTQLINKRDSICKEIMNHKGRVFIISLKSFPDFNYPEIVSELFQVGRMRIYPNGIGKYSVNNFELKCDSLPVIFPLNNFIKIISKFPPGNGSEYKVTYSGKNGTDTYYNAVVSTKEFELKAPKIKIIKNNERIKIIVFPKAETAN